MLLVFVAHCNFVALETSYYMAVSIELCFLRD